jgi:hypothetical protein
VGITFVSCNVDDKKVKVDVPKIDVPDINIPDINLPKIDLSKVKTIVKNQGDKIKIKLPNFDDTSINSLITAETDKILAKFEIEKNLEKLTLNFDFDTYKTTYNNRNILSTVYKGDRNNEGNAYPSKFVYSVNIDLDSKKVVKLSDIVDIKKPDSAFIKNLISNAETQLKSTELGKSGFDFSEEFSPKKLHEILNSESLKNENFAWYADGNAISVYLPVAHALGDYLEIKSIVDTTVNKVVHTSFTDTAFVEQTTFKALKEAYSAIDFNGEFKSSDPELDAEYKAKFQQLLEGKETFWDKTTQKEYYVNQFGELKWGFVPNDCVYYFFDMDGDSTPELGISDGARFIYIMKYNPDTEQISLWCEIDTTWTKLMGSGKFWYYSGTSPKTEYAFYELDANGVIKCSVVFYVEVSTYEETYMVAMPNDEDYEFFRVTKSQWDELTQPFFQAREKSQTDIKAVTYTFEELFG